MESVSILPQDFFAGQQMTRNAINCRVEYYVDDLKTPSNLCVKQTGGLSSAWCCKYQPNVPSGSASANDVSRCWNMCPSWEQQAADLKV